MAFEEVFAEDLIVDDLIFIICKVYQVKNRNLGTQYSAVFIYKS